MTDRRSEGPGENGEPVPRDLPDQQAGAGDDRWEVAPVPGGGDEEAAATDVPDTDEAGSGRKGAPHPGGVHPGQPVPDESTD